MVTTERAPSVGRPGETPEETRARLRDLIRRLEARPARPRPVARAIVRDPGDEAVGYRPYYPAPMEEVFPASVRRETDAGTCTYLEVTYPLDHHVGTQPLRDIAHVSPATYALLAPDEGAEEAALEDLVFLDIESTGLGGAGAMAFLVATGRFEASDGSDGATVPGAFVLRQYLALSPPEEGAVVAALIEDTRVRDGDPVLVTYNGRAFDAPMLDSRATMHRMRAGFDTLRHVDLLAPMRTGLRGAMASCRLAVVENEVLGLTRPPGEVAGGDVPAWYFRYLRSRDARMLAPIVEHNALDVVSLGAILARFGALLARAREATPLDAVALGRLHAARGQHERATGHLQRALAELPGCPLRDDTLLRLATLHRKAGRRDLAEPLWREAAARPGVAALRPLVEVAKALEHDRRDFASALAVVAEAELRVQAYARFDPRWAARWQEELTRRRARLERRLARAG